MTITEQELKSFNNHYVYEEASTHYKYNDNNKYGPYCWNRFQDHFFLRW